jgi:anti-sigma-K factor RskA
MSMTSDPFEFDDAAYVLGALDEDERAAFEAHLADCPQCRRRVEELRGLPAQLALGSPEEIEQDVDEQRVPDTLLPALLRRAKARQRRRRAGFGALAAAAAACLAAAIVAFWPSSAAPHGDPMTALAQVPVAATAQLHRTAWGTEIRLDCHYTRGVSNTYAYGLTVVDTDGRRHELGSWSLPPGDSIAFTSGTSVPVADIAKVQITADGKPVLQLVP